MNALRNISALAALSATLLSGCSSPGGRGAESTETVAPNQISDFGTLYAQNCAGCHGAEGRGGAAIALADPVYLAIADNLSMRKVIAGGVRGTAMPAFTQSAGGMLTDKQIDVITEGMRSRWGRPGILNSAHPPSYAPKSPGDAQRGEAAYKTYCESCHGPGGRGGPKGSAITNDVGPRCHGPGCLARLAAGAKPRSAIFCFQWRVRPGVCRCQMKRCSRGAGCS